MNKGKKNLGNAIWSVLDVAVYPVFQLVFTPFFINQLGPSLYGLWTLLTSVMVSLQLFNLGLGMGTFRNVAFHWNKGDKQDARNTLNVNISLTALLFLPILLTTVILALSVVHLNLFNLEDEIKTYTAVCFVLSSFVVLFRLCDQVFQSSYKAIERFDKAALINTLLRMSIFGAYLLILFRSPDVRWVIFGNISISAVYFAIQMHLSKQLLGGAVKFGIDWVLAKEELNFSKWLWLQSIAVILAFQFADRYLVVQFYGLEVLGYYSIMAVLINHIHMGLTAAVSWVFPKFTEREKDRESFYRTVRNSLLTFSLFMLMIFYTISDWFFEFWLGEDNSSMLADYIGPFIAFEMIFIFTISPYFYLNGRKKEKLATYLFFVTTGLHIVGMLVAYTLGSTPKSIIYGMIIASIVSACVNNYIINLRFLQKSLIYEAGLILLPQLLAVSSIVFFEYGSKEFIFSSLLALLSMYLIYIRPTFIDLKLLRS